MVTAKLEGDAFTLDVAFDIVYSSTCPASTALARQLVAEDFGNAFPANAPLDRNAALRWLAGEHGMRATPHSQRSTASICVRLDPVTATLPFTALIERAEAALGTPVQTAVKRIDEQAFARRNGENPMFCEDAARRLQAAFDVGPACAISTCACPTAKACAHDAVAEAGKPTQTRSYATDRSSPGYNGSVILAASRYGENRDDRAALWRCACRQCAGPTSVCTAWATRIRPAALGR